MQTSIKTYGCTLNQADSELMGNILSNDGISVSEGTVDASDVVIVNTCTVKRATEQKILYALSNLEKTGKKVVVTGCMASANKNLIEKYAPHASIVTTSNIQNITSAVKSAAKGEKVIFDQYTRADKLIFFKDSSSVVSKIPISEGCLSSCGFCETKVARGPLNSFSEERILNAISFSVKRGAKEIQLASQDTGAYGIDRKTNIAKLVKKIALIDGDFKVRVGMLNPEHLKHYLEELIQGIQDDRFYKFLHLPIQSGSNKVLAEMRRLYTVEQFNEYVDRIRSAIPNITIETDVIVGYPTETEQDFQMSMDFIEKTMPEVTNVSKFGLRPHTAAVKLEQISNQTISERSKILARAVRAAQHRINERFIGHEFDVLITEEAETSMNGRNEYYKQIVIPKSGAEIKVGSTHRVKILSKSCNVLYGKPVSSPILAVV